MEVLHSILFFIAIKLDGQAKSFLIVKISSVVVQPWPCHSSNMPSTHLLSIEWKENFIFYYFAFYTFPQIFLITLFPSCFAYIPSHSTYGIQCLICINVTEQFPVNNPMLSIHSDKIEFFASLFLSFMCGMLSTFAP